MKREKDLADKAVKSVRARQLGLELPRPAPRYEPSSFVVSDGNRSALEFGVSLVRTGERAFVVAGARASGKSHLLHVLASEARARVLSAAKFFDTGAELDKGATWVAVDDCDCGVDPNRLLERLEWSRYGGLRLILAGAQPVTAWAHGLRDLETRLAALPAVILPEPDDSLLDALIRQHFATRQLKTAPDVARFAAPRLPRTFAAADDFVNAVAKIAAEEGRPITVAAAKIAIGRLFEAGDNP